MSQSGDSPYVFPSSRGSGPITAHAATRAISRARPMLGIENFRVHDLRRTVATSMASLGVNPHTISLVLDHISVTKGTVTGAIYVKYSFDPEKLIEALDKFIEIGYIYNEESKGTIFLLKAVKYIYSLWDIKTDEDYKEKIEHILGKQGVDVMTILEDIELKAEKRGEIRGKIIDKQDILIRLLKKKFGLSRDEVTLIKSIDDITIIINSVRSFHKFQNIIVSTL